MNVIETTLELTRLMAAQDKQFSFDRAGATGISEFMLLTKATLELMEQNKPLDESLTALYAVTRKDYLPGGIFPQRTPNTDDNI